jgi:hypothetical protein
MRDLEGIAEINGPRCAELQAERAQNVKAQSIPALAKRIQTLHADRVEQRQRVNGEGFTPEIVSGTLTRAVRCALVQGRHAWHGEYRLLERSGLDPSRGWRKVCNSDQQPIVYTTPGYAIGAAVLHREAHFNELTRRGVAAAQRVNKIS